MSECRDWCEDPYRHGLQQPSAATGQSSVQGSEAEVVVHAYIAAAQDEMDEMDLEGDEQGQDDMQAATVLELPNIALEGVWER